MDGRCRPDLALPLQDRTPPLPGRAPPPIAARHPADDRLFSRRLPIPHSPRALEERLAAQHRDIQVLLCDNQQLAASHVSLKNELNASQHQLRLVAASVANAKAERDTEVRQVYEQSLKLDPDVRAIEGMRAELAQVRSDVQSLGVSKDELAEQLQKLKRELAENQRAIAISADVEVMRREIQKGRAAIEFEKKAHVDNLEQSRIMENNIILMAHEIEKLRAELANTEMRAQAAAASSGYAVTYPNPQMVYGANSYVGTYTFQQQITADGTPQGAVAHGQYDIAQTNSQL